MTSHLKFVSFSGKKRKKACVLQEGLEPPTLGLLDPCSTKRSYQSERATTRDRSGDLQIFSLTLSQLSYSGEDDALDRHPDFFLAHEAYSKPNEKNNALRHPGIEPGSNAWEASMITITLQALNTPGGDRTRDPRLIRPVLYR